MTAPMRTSKTSSLSLIKPRFGTERQSGRETYGDRVAFIASQMGWELMPWQRLVADVGLEVDSDTGRLAYREVVVTVPRQNGKSSLLLAVECARCLMWGGPQNVAYTAQTGLDGRMKFLDDQMPMLENSVLNGSIDRVYRAAHNTALTWKNGSRISVLSTGEKSGHGKTLDLAVIDEAFADMDNRREQALLPTMATRVSPQMWNVSTAGTPSSTYLRRKVDVGRAAVNGGKTSGIAYFEWSIPDDADVDDPVVWAEFMPAYGITITEETVAHARQTMTDGDFRRAFGNQWTDTEERLIPAEWWAAASQHGVEADVDSSVFAVDARVDRSAAVVTVGDADGNVELVEFRPGVSWVLDWFVGGESSRRERRVVVDRNGPLGGVADELERAGLLVVRLDSVGVRKTCGTFFDGLSDGKVRVRDNSLISEAVSHAANRSTADSWAWHREAPGGEILMGLSLAYGVATQLGSPGVWFA